MADDRLPEPVTLEWLGRQLLDFQAEMRAHAGRVSDSLRLDIAAEQQRAENDMVMALFSKMRRIDEQHRSMQDRLAAIEERLQKQ